VLLPDGGGTNGVLHQIGVDLQTTVFEVRQQRSPLTKRIVERFAPESLWQEALAALPMQQDAPQSLDHWTAFNHAGKGSLLGACATLPQPGLGTVEVLDQLQDQRRLARGVFACGEELAPG